MIIRLLSVITILILSSSTLIQAQISLNSQDILNMIGTVTEAEVDTNGNVPFNAGSAGENQIWDFTSTNISGYQLPIEYITPDGTPFASDFPEANFAQKSAIIEDDIEAELYTYDEVRSSEFVNLGSGIVSGDLKVLQERDEDNTPLPLTYGSSWITNVSDTINIVDTYYIVNISMLNTIIDGWGVLKLPIGDFQSLRLRDDNTEISQIYINNIMISSDTTSSVGYTWIGKEVLMLLYAESHDDVTDPDFTTAKEFGWLTNFSTTDINNDLTQNVPGKYELNQNYPNPFNPETIISYSLPQKSDVSISIYDITGQLIDNITPGLQSAGTHEVRWQAAHHLASGAYMYRIQAGDFVSTKKMILLR